MALTAAGPISAASNDFEDEHWIFSDFDERADAVNEGPLRLLDDNPIADYHHHQNIITLLADSHQHGWANLEQCHYNLDAVDALQITFNAKRLRDLSIVSSKMIERVWVEDASVQMEGVGKGASVCLSAQTRVVWPNADGSYSVRNGPYMRQFLDGYYPMQVSLELRYSTQQWQLKSYRPANIPWQLTTTGLRMKVHFEGKLRTEIRFAAVPAQSLE